MSQLTFMFLYRLRIMVIIKKIMIISQSNNNNSITHYLWLPKEIKLWLIQAHLTLCVSNCLHESSNFSARMIITFRIVVIKIVHVEQKIQSGIVSWLIIHDYWSCTLMQYAICTGNISLLGLSRELWHKFYIQRVRKEQ